MHLNPVGSTQSQFLAIMRILVQTFVWTQTPFISFFEEHNDVKLLESRALPRNQSEFLEALKSLARHFSRRI
jgi:hypothetical protein